MSVYDIARIQAALADIAVAPPVRREWERSYVAVVAIADIVAAAIAATFAFNVRFQNGAEWESVTYGWASVLVPVLWLLAVAAQRAYEPRYLGVGSEEFRRVLAAGVGLTAAVATISWASAAELARGYVVIALPLCTVLTLIGRYAVRKQLHTLRSRGHCVHRVLVVGHVGSAAALVRQVRRAPYHGLHIVGACVPRDHPHDALADKHVPIVGDLEDVGAAVDRVAADTVAVLACPEIDDSALRRLSWQLQRTGTDLLVAPALTDVAGPRLAIRPVDGLPLLHVEQPELAGGRRFLKAAVDRTVAALAILALSPLLIAIAVAVRVPGRGPIIFRQTRVGLRGEEFTMFKFRSMVADAEDRRQDLVAYNENDGVLFKIRSDPRVTPVGGWLRRRSLDELPQLFNILNGTMSLVGPRPPLPGEVAVYADDVTRRLLVKPGLTGLWQISGRSDLSWDESIRLDLRYVENWSLALDFMILWKTMFVVLRGRGAY